MCARVVPTPDHSVLTLTQQPCIRTQTSFYPKPARRIYLQVDLLHMWCPVWQKCKLYALQELPRQDTIKHETLKWSDERRAWGCSGRDEGNHQWVAHIVGLLTKTMSVCLVRCPGVLPCRPWLLMSPGVSHVWEREVTVTQKWMIRFKYVTTTFNPVINTVRQTVEFQDETCDTYDTPPTYWDLSVSGTLT